MRLQAACLVCAHCCVRCLVGARGSAAQPVCIVRVLSPHRNLKGKGIYNEEIRSLREWDWSRWDHHEMVPEQSLSLLSGEQHEPDVQCSPEHWSSLAEAKSLSPLALRKWKQYCVTDKRTPLSLSRLAPVGWCLCHAGWASGVGLHLQSWLNRSPHVNNGRVERQAISAPGDGQQLGCHNTCKFSVKSERSLMIGAGLCLFCQKVPSWDRSA